MTEITVEALERAGMTQEDLADARADAARAGMAVIRRFVLAEALPGVYAAYGCDPYDGDDLPGALAHAEAFGNAHLDLRRGAPRSRNVPSLPKAQEVAVMRMGEETGMLGESDAHDQPVDLVLVHGSYKEGIYRRTVLGRQQYDAQAIAFPERRLTLLGAATGRPLTVEDHLSAVQYAPWAETEFDLLDTAVHDEFGAVLVGEEIYDEDEHGQPYTSNSGIARRYAQPDGYVVSAPRVNGTRFANTADTHEFTLRVLGVENVLGRAVLGTTTQVYVPFQELDILRAWGLRYGARVRMAGYHDPAWTQPAHVGQEINSVFDQGTMLLAAVRQAQVGTKQGATE